MKERDDELEEITLDGLKGISSEKKYHYIIVLVMIGLFVMGFSAGNRLGYINGYSYVQDWYEAYINKSCFCSELDDGAGFDLPQELTVVKT